jgi:hypothetical protein
MARAKRTATPTPQAIGDDAAAAGIPLVPGSVAANTIDSELNTTRDYVARFGIKPGTALAVARGGTGGTTPETARAALGTGYPVPYPPDAAATPNTVAVRGSNARLLVGEPVGNTDATTKGYVDGRISSIPGGSGLADGPTSAAYNRGTTGTSYFTVWMNAQLQFFRNTSSKRYKKRIRDWKSSGVMGLRTVIFDRIGGDPDEVGFIAEEVLKHIPEAVLYFDGKVDGVNDRVILAALVDHVQELTRRLETLEAARSS